MPTSGGAGAAFFRATAPPKRYDDHVTRVHAAQETLCRRCAGIQGANKQLKTEAFHLRRRNEQLMRENAELAQNLTAVLEAARQHELVTPG